MDTLILDHLLKVASSNEVYKVQTTKYSQDIIKQLLNQTNKDKDVHKVYKLPSMEQTVRYLHAVAGHPTKETWLKAIAKGNYNLWPLIDTKNARTHFPESKETQYEHMRGQLQGVQSTWREQPVHNECDEGKFEKIQDIFIHVYKLDKDDRLTNVIYSDQTGDFPYISSQENRSIMVIHHVNSNSFWVEPL